MIKYEPSPEIKNKIEYMVLTLGLEHIDLSRLACFRSSGSASRAIARCYALSKIWQATLNTKAHYIIEVISEKFDRLSDSDKEKVLIHELMHIPKAFGGGFRQHDFVCARNVEAMHKQLKMHASSSAPQNSILRQN
ncbi:MAG: metallopeptidase [DPANN group archaeon]|nr:metallopeptidase [DPANN group archaeon]